MTAGIQVVINGETEKVPGALSITGLIRHYKEDDGHLIVEHNGRFVYPRNYETTPVEDGDVLEFINPNFGG
ncbi:MAG: sulfur carrier protein ThiS [Deltaproteobacteria bacterium]|nr:sulfur carrier protein ThiS [Deltaproteobacteria bacterium]MBW1818541.1 sulfur carrier protein ThiS [Deltaproteobacteria bacterium]